MRTLKVLTAASLLALAATSAHAAFTVSASKTAPAGSPGTMTSIAVAGLPLGTATVTTANYQLSFDVTPAGEGVVTGNGGLNATPVAGPGPEYLTGDAGSALTTNVASAGHYLSTGTGSITIAFATPQSALELLWGSIDPTNTLTFSLGGVTEYTLTGSELMTLSGIPATGFQGFGGSAYVTVNDTAGTFDTVAETSGVVSFESAGIVGSTSLIGTPAPEPVSLALLGSGLIAVGAARRNRR